MLFDFFNKRSLSQGYNGIQNIEVGAIATLPQPTNENWFFLIANL
ncbi:MAG: hypothetical protein AAGJ08_14630 [Cyanobacteria bacterium P01_H01_bin.35]